MTILNILLEAPPAVDLSSTWIAFITTTIALVLGGNSLLSKYITSKQKNKATELEHDFELKKLDVETEATETHRLHKEISKLQDDLLDADARVEKLRLQVTQLKDEANVTAVMMENQNGIIERYLRILKTLPETKEIFALWDKNDKS